MAIRTTIGSNPLALSGAFRAAFKEAAFACRMQLADALASVFQLPEQHPMWGETLPFWGQVKALPEDHPIRAELIRRHGHMPDLAARPLWQFDASVARQVLRAGLAESSFSLYDYDEPYLGGYPSAPWKTAELYPSPPPVDGVWREGWDIEPLVQAYWSDPENERQYQQVSDFPFYIERESTSVREQVDSALGFEQMNVAGALAYQGRLITLNFPELEPRKVVSDRRTRRYAKQLDNGIFLGLHAQFSAVESDLKRGYVSLPELNVEVFDESVVRPLKPESYLRHQDELAIARIKLPVAFFMKGAIERRMGSIGSTPTEDIIKRAAFYHSAVQAQYLRLCFPFIERVLYETVSSS